MMKIYGSYWGGVANYNIPAIIKAVCTLDEKVLPDSLLQLHKKVAVAAQNPVSEKSGKTSKE